MSSTPTTNVSAAFDILLEAMEEEIELMNRRLSAATEQRDYERARSSLDQSEQMTDSWRQVAKLRNRWLAAFGSVDEGEDDEGSEIVRRDLGRLQRGLRTPDQAFFRPLLSALVEMGGRGRSSDVVDRVGKMMKNQLKEVDYYGLASDDTPRWRNTAHWARYQLVQDGLFKADSPRGIWEISDKGRAYLAENKPS